MFGRSKPVVFEPYSSRRSKRRVPRWLLLLLLGIAAGAAGVIYVQERHLPPRLSAAETAQLRDSFAQADAGRKRLQAELAETAKNLAATTAENKRLADELSASRQTVERLREDVAFVAAALPPDPRGGAVEVRAARITSPGKTLAYEVALSREGARGKPLAGVMQLTVSGESARGGESTIALEPIAISVPTHQVLRGSQPLPEGFVPRQCTIRVLDRPGGQMLGMRVMFVK
jgi:hypothetical protein